MNHHPFSWWDSSLSSIRVVNPSLYLPQTYSISLSFKLYTSLQWIEKLNKEIVSIESVKATEGINIDSDCILLENNENLAENLDNLNNDPENVETGYLVKIKKKD